ncbi:sensor histidine kinase [Synoicihabitans lomoniglobus]|uniref:histidine kinase n=1 Tax=Synoicihabitans lomoniglobus TaxID=2909285 RepID=A0AAE9ZYK2_9BACT|nr:ATP-binding protein [Opitutaceae bacterium LMO-M01]WED65754.1 ATP-binding protein [Opitutaceae bacterium LMO-M01]
MSPVRTRIDRYHPQHWTFLWSPTNRQLIGIFSLIGLLALGVVGLAYRSARTAQRIKTEIDFTFNVRDQIEHVETLARGLQIGTRGYLLAGEMALLQPYDVARTELPNALAELETLLSNDSHTAKLVRLRELIAQDIAYREELVSTVETTDLATARALVANRIEVRKSQDLISKLCEDMKQDATDLLNKYRDSQTANDRIAAVAQTVITLMMLMGTWGIYLYVRYHLDQRRSAEVQLAAKNETLVEANQELESFCYSVSHDLRAPLRHIQGYAQMLQKNAGDSLTAKAQRHLLVISDAAAEMGRLIDDLLAFSRLGRAQLSLDRIDLDGIVKDCIERVLRTTPPERKIEWSVGSLPTVEGDRAMLTQVFTNLISNAVKYTGPRDPARIEITRRQEKPGVITIEIADNGVGFDMKYLPKLFGVFQRLHRSDEFEGTGVGLALVRRILTKHGGSIRAQAEKDRGAQFFVNFPSPRPLRTKTGASRSPALATSHPPSSS